MKQKAFTLIELLVVIGIIGILSAIGVVSFGAVREKARRGACIATLRSNFNSDENLVAYWNFDEQSPGTVAPTTAGAIKDFWEHNGTVTGNPVYQDGIIDSALSFDGNDYVSIFSTQNFKKEEGTIEMWVKPSFNIASIYPDPLQPHIYFFQTVGNNKMFQIWNSNGYLYWLEGWTGIDDTCRSAYSRRRHGDCPDLRMSRSAFGAS